MTRTARANDQWQRDSAHTRQPDWLEPELATLTADRFSDPAWIFERKFDGERCLAFRAGQQLRLMTRSQQQVTSTYPEIADALRAQEGSDFIVDGEVVAFDGDKTSFSRLQRRLGVRDPGPALRAEVPVYLYVFDVLWADGRDVRPLPLRERKRLLRGLLSFRDPLRFTDHRDADGEAYWREACSKGWEGIIAKRADSPYRPGRTRDWLKFKCENGQEFVIGGYTDPRGSRTGFGALLLGYYDSDGKLRVRRQGRHRLRSAHPDQPARGPGCRRETGSGLRARPRPAQVQGALGPTPARRAGRFHRMDGGRAAAPSQIPGPAAGQGPRRRGTGNALKGPA